MDRGVGLRAGGYRQKGVAALYSNTQLQILSVAIFKQMPWQQVRTANAHAPNTPIKPKQLNLFEV